MSLINRIKDSFKESEVSEGGKVSFELPLPSLNEKYIADSNYIFVYQDSDGFSERLLKKTLFVDTAFCYEINFRALQESNISKQSIRTVVKGQLPVSIKNLLQELMNTPDLSDKLKPDYAAHMLTDAGQTYYSFNLKSGLVQISDRPYATVENKLKFNLTELKFLEFAKELDAWTEKMFLLFVNEI